MFTVQAAEMPPLTLIVCPVILEAAGEHKKTARGAMSLGVTSPNRAFFVTFSKSFLLNSPAITRS